MVAIKGNNMISINPINPTTYTFKRAQNNPSESLPEAKNKKELYLSLAGLAAAGAAVVLAGKKSVSTFEQALKKNGVEIKDGIAVLVSNGERYTGTVKRNTKAFGIKKETVQYSNGVMTEKVYHNIKGSELEGEFYKNGVLRVKVSKDCQDERYARHIFDSNGELEARESCINTFKDKFELARKAIKEL